MSSSDNHTVRTRFAPSPTGFMHVGNLRTGLFAWLVARHYGGQFVLRLEDTDKNREVEGSAEHILDCLNILGLDRDEGLDTGGPYAPYRQSDRLDIYKQWAQRLIDAGRAYADPYTSEEVQAFREQAKADKRAFLYRDHRPESASQRTPAWDGTQPLRFKSDPKAYVWSDEVMGDLSTGPEVIDDFILIKSDGYPTYNFAHIVDDAAMQITHVIRGQEFISSMPNYLNLYEALDIELPVFATMPHIMNENGNKKLGKRDGAKDVLEYIREGYLPETLLGFIATLGWNDGTEQEIFTRDELIAKFSLDRVQKSGARFDDKRLAWMNGQFIRQLKLDDLYSRVSGHASQRRSTTSSEDSKSKDASFSPASGDTSRGSTQNSFAATRESILGADDVTGPEDSEAHQPEQSSGEANGTTFWPTSANTATESYKKQVLALVQDRLKTLADLSIMTDYFFEEPTVDWSLVETNKQLKKLDKAEIKSLLTSAKDKLANSTWNADDIQSDLNQLLEDTQQKPAVLFSLIRLAVSWAPFSPQLNDTLDLLGKERVVARLEQAIVET